MRDVSLYKKRKNIFVILGIALVTVMLATACVSSPECPQPPEWISQPEMEGYYVGVGSADSGNPAEDRPVAESRARADLAARISVQISSDMKVATESSSAGVYSQEVEEVVSQSVEKNIREIETVDSYHCPGMGTWVYVRLSRAKWAQIREERRAEIVRRVQDLVDPVMTNNDATLRMRLDRFNRGYEVIRESSFGEKIIADLAGESGNVSDILKNQLSRHIGSLQIESEREEIDLEVGESFSLTGRILSDLMPQTGVFEIRLVNQNDEILAGTQSDIQGNFSLQLPAGFTSPGEQKLYLRPDIEADSSLSLEIGGVQIVEEEIVVNVRRISAGLRVGLRGSEVQRSIVNEVRALFSDQDLPFEFSDELNPEGYNLDVVIFVEDFPQVLENAPLMSKSWAVVNLRRNGNSLYSVETPAVKDGGITLDQAHSRVLSKLLSELRGNRDLFQNLKSALKDS